MIALEPNPVVTREVRARWRGVRAFALLFLYAALLVTAMIWHCMDYLPDSWNLSANLSAAALPGNSATPSLASLGHETFAVMTWIQVAGWMLLAPALTATSIAGERERGLLEALQLSQLSAWHIVAGKLLSALSFVLLMILASLPVLSTCFLLGGVSPVDFCLAILLNLGTAITCAAMGLACSAWCRRANAALTVTFLMVAAWGLGSIAAYDMTLPAGSSYIRSFLGFSPLGSPNGALIATFVDLFGQSNPIVAAYAATETDFANQLLANPASTGIPPVLVSFVFEALLASALLWLAVRGTCKFFSEQPIVQRKRVLTLRRGTTGNFRLRLAPAMPSIPASSASSVSPAPPQLSPENLQNVMGTSADGIADPASNQDDAPAAKWYEVPLLSFLRLANPLLHREVHSKFRMRQAPWLIFIEAVVGIGIAIIYIFCLFAACEGREASEVWGAISLLGLLAIVFATSIMGAKAFTREREAGTWDALLLSLLTPRDIIKGKLGAPLLICWIFSLPWWPVLALCTYPPRFTANHYNTVSLIQAIAVTLVVAATAWFCTAWGLYFSWVCRRTGVAVGWTLGTLFIAWVMVPIFLSAVATDGPWVYDSPLHQMAGLLPFLTTAHLLADADKAGTNILYDGLVSALMLFGLGCSVLLLLHRAMRRGAFEKGQPRASTPQVSTALANDGD